jgi:hypothetical protein
MARSIGVQGNVNVLVVRQSDYENFRVRSIEPTVNKKKSSSERSDKPIGPRGLRAFFSLGECVDGPFSRSEGDRTGVCLPGRRAILPTKPSTLAYKEGQRFANACYFDPRD